MVAHEASTAGLEERHGAAQACFAGVSLSFESFETFVVARLGDEVPSDPIAADLFLACAHLAGDSHAIGHLERGYFSQVPSFVARIEKSESGGEEVQQLLRQRILLPSGDKPPRLAEYQGRGRLTSWLRVAAIRLALSRRASAKGDLPDDRAEELAAAADVELDHLRQRYAEPFREAFAGALLSLQPRERTVLRMQLVDDLSSERVAEIYRVHRATVARWLSSARLQLFEQTRQRLHQELGVSDSEFASIAALVRSELDVSICRILAESEESPVD